MKTQLWARCGAAEPGFRRFFAGYTTSLLGSSMAATATTFAILDSGKSAADLGYVMAAGIVPIVLCLLGGGVVADRIGSRRVMLAADCVRCLAQVVFAIVLFTCQPPLWVYVVLVMVRGAGEGFFGPALSALIPQLTGAAELSDANALMGMASSAAAVAGPALSGIVVALFGPATVLALDAASYGVSVLALRSVRVSGPPAREPQSVFADLREGWTEFRSRSWVWLTTIQFALFNFFVWAPFLVLGPVLAHQRYGGASAWGVTMACYGVGSIAGGVALLGRRPRRPILVATIATFAYACPSFALALHAPLFEVDLAVLLAGVGSAVCGALYSTTNQRLLPPAVLARVSSYNTLGSFVLGPLGLAIAGPIALVAGISRVLMFGVVWQVVASGILVCLPAIRFESPLLAVEGLGESGESQGEGLVGVH